MFLQSCLLIVRRRFLMTKWRSWMMQAVIGACFLITSATIKLYGKLKKLRYCERITSHWLRNITGVLKDTMSWNRWYAETYCKWFTWKWWFKHSLLLQDGGAVWCLGNSTCRHRAQRDKRQDTVLFVIRENILSISSFLNFCSFLSVMEDD